jgi:hypothetical protein
LPPSTRDANAPPTALYPVIQHHLESFLAVAADHGSSGQGVPPWAEEDFRAYLRCGGFDPASGPSVMRILELFQDRGLKSADREPGRRKAA